MSDDKSGSPEIKVLDRRWFTDEGELRRDRPVAPPKVQPTGSPKGSSRAEQEPVVAPPPSEAARAREEAPATARATSQAFLELVAMLAQQAELLLVGGQGFPRQPEQARRLIDYLGVLEGKTLGNLSAEEKQLLSNAIFQLRTLYLQAGR